MGLFDLSGKVAISCEDAADCERTGHWLKTLAIPADVADEANSRRWSMAR